MVADEMLVLAVTSQVAEEAKSSVPKLMYWVSKPVSVPLLTPDPSSRMLCVAAPPSTIPLNLAPGSTMTRLLKPAARVTASPPLLPLLI